MSAPSRGWLSAAELTRLYCVGEQRLLEHAQRGNLPCRHNPRGALEFDGGVAGELFRLRVQAEEVWPARAGSGFGVLGQVVLGSQPRANRRRAAARLASWPSDETAAERKSSAA